MGENLNGRLCGQPRKLVTSAFSAKSFPCSALPIVAGSSTVKLLLRLRPRVFRGIRGRRNAGSERVRSSEILGPMRPRTMLAISGSEDKGGNRDLIPRTLSHHRPFLSVARETAMGIATEGYDTSRESLHVIAISTGDGA